MNSGWKKIQGTKYDVLVRTKWSSTLIYRKYELLCPKYNFATQVDHVRLKVFESNFIKEQQ